MSLSRPRASLTLDGRTLSSAESAVAHVEVRLRSNGAHDDARVILWSQSRFNTASPGASLAVAIGEEGSEVDVWSGKVSRVAASPDGIVLEGLSPTAALSSTWVSQTYRDQTVADIVRDLASSVDVDTVEGDLSLSCYSVDDRRPVWAHILGLADLVGADVAASARGGLRFVVPKTGTSNTTLRFGADVLSWEGGAATERPAERAAAYGAGSEAGADQWHWLLNGPPAAGKGEGPVQIRGALRTRDAADKAAQSLAEQSRRSATRLALRILGNADLRPGDLVDVRDLPGADLGTLRVLSVVHELAARDGFATGLLMEGA